MALTADDGYSDLMEEKPREFRRKRKSLFKLSLIILASAYPSAIIIGFFWFFPAFLGNNSSGIDGAWSGFLTLTMCLVFLFFVSIPVLFFAAFIVSKISAGHSRRFRISVAVLVGILIALAFPLIDFSTTLVR